MCVFNDRRIDRCICINTEKRTYICTGVYIKDGPDKEKIKVSVVLQDMIELPLKEIIDFKSYGKQRVVKCSIVYLWRESNRV